MKNRRCDDHLEINLETGSFLWGSVDAAKGLSIGRSRNSCECAISATAQPIDIARGSNH
jgi:hypothetical protein